VLNMHCCSAGAAVPVLLANPSLNLIGRVGPQHSMSGILVPQQYRYALVYPCPPVTSRQSNGFRFVGSLAGAGQVLTVIKFIEFDQVDSGSSVLVAEAAPLGEASCRLGKLRTIPYELLGGKDSPLTKSMRVHLTIRPNFAKILAI